MKKWLCLAVCCAVALCGLPQAFAEEFYFKNGDKISGKLLKSDEETYQVQTENLGAITISKKSVEKVGPPAPTPTPPAPKVGKPKLWTGKFFGGFSRQRGNTNTSELSGGIEIKRKEEKKNEFDVKTDAFYSEQDRKMNAQRYSAMTRYAFNFGESKKWINFYKGEADHDRFANIYARYTPSTGLGYWFVDNDEWKFLTECGLGGTYTHYSSGQKSRWEMVVTPHLYLEKRLIGKSRISEDFLLYPSLTGDNTYRWKSDTTFKNPITDRLNLKVSYINEFNSEPGADKKELDMRLVTGLEYLF